MIKGRHPKQPGTTQLSIFSMNRISQIDPTTATGKAQKLFTTVQSQLGFVPNLMRVLGNSPAVLEGFLSFSGALAAGLLSPKLRTQIALAVAEIDGCGYCLSIHTVLGGTTGLSPDEVTEARRVAASDEKSNAALKFVRAIMLQRGLIADCELLAARNAGLSDAEIVEVVAHVALNILTNYTNGVARTVIDFPEMKPGEL